MTAVVPSVSSRPDPHGGNRDAGPWHWVHHSLKPKTPAQEAAEAKWQAAGLAAFEAKHPHRVRPLPKLKKVWGKDRTAEYMGRDLHAEGLWKTNPAKARYGTIIFDKDGRILLREPKGHFSGMVWTFPKGHSDPNEHPVEVARRETLEETGLNPAIVGHLEPTYTGSTGEDHFYLAHVDGTQNPEWLNGETDRLTWANPSEAEQLLSMSTNSIARERDLWALHDAVSAHARLYPKVSTPMPPRTTLTVAPTVAFPHKPSQPPKGSPGLPHGSKWGEGWSKAQHADWTLGAGQNTTPGLGGVPAHGPGPGANWVWKGGKWQLKPKSPQPPGVRAAAGSRSWAKWDVEHPYQHLPAHRHPEAAGLDKRVGDALANTHFEENGLMGVASLWVHPPVTDQHGQLWSHIRYNAGRGRTDREQMAEHMRAHGFEARVVDSGVMVRGGHSHQAGGDVDMSRYGPIGGRPRAFQIVASVASGTRDWAQWDIDHPQELADRRHRWAAAGHAAFLAKHPHHDRPVGDRRSRWTDTDREVVGHAQERARQMPAGERFGGRRKMTDREFEQHRTHVERQLAEHGADDLMRSPFSTHNSEDRLGNVEGVYHPQRAEQHKQLLDEIMRNAAEVPNDRQALVTAGLGGAGKSTTLRKGAAHEGSVAHRMGIKYRSYDSEGNGVGEPTNFLTLNPDDIKEKMAERGMIPEVGDLSPMERSTFVHEEASHITHLLGQRAMAEGKNIIHDITLNSVKSGEVRLGPLRDRGYGVGGVMVDVSPEHSARNAVNRHLHGQDRLNAEGSGFGGRFVPSHLILNARDETGQYRSKNRAAFEEMKRRGMYDRTVTVDNEGNAGRIIDESGTRAAGDNHWAAWDAEHPARHGGGHHPIRDQIDRYKAGEIPWADLHDFLATYDYKTPSHYRPGQTEHDLEAHDHDEPGTFDEVSTAHAQGKLSDAEYGRIVRSIAPELDEGDTDPLQGGTRAAGDIEHPLFSKHGKLSNWWKWDLEHPWIHKGHSHSTQLATPEEHGGLLKAKAEQNADEQIGKGAVHSDHRLAYITGHQLGHGVGLKLAGDADVVGQDSKQVSDRAAPLYAAAKKAKDSGDFEGHAALLGAAHGFKEASKAKAVWEKANGVTPHEDVAGGKGKKVAGVAASVAAPPAPTHQWVQAKQLLEGDLINTAASTHQEGLPTWKVSKVIFEGHNGSLISVYGKQTPSSPDHFLGTHDANKPILKLGHEQPDPAPSAEPATPATLEEHIANATAQGLDFNAVYDHAKQAGLEQTASTAEANMQLHAGAVANMLKEGPGVNSVQLATYHAQALGYKAALAEHTGAQPTPVPSVPLNPYALGMKHDAWQRAHDEAFAHAQAHSMAPGVALQYASQHSTLAKTAPGGVSAAAMEGLAAGYQHHADVVNAPPPRPLHTPSGLSNDITVGMLKTGDSLPSGHMIGKVVKSPSTNQIGVSVIGPTNAETEHHVLSGMMLNQLIKAHDQKVTEQQAEPAGSGLPLSTPVDSIYAGFTTPAGHQVVSTIHNGDSVTVTLKHPGGEELTTKHGMAANLGDVVNDQTAILEHHPEKVYSTTLDSQYPPHGTTVLAPDALGSPAAVTHPQTEADLAKLTPKSQGEKFANGEKVPGTGTSGGQWYEDPATGQAYFLKGYKSDAHSMNEVAGSLAYQQAGVHTQNISLVKMGDGKLRALAHYRTGLKPVTPSTVTPATQAEARKGFGMDALLSHYDVFGLPSDSSGRNLFKDEHGNVVRLDLGGTGRFRAQGTPKPTPEWSAGDWAGAEPGQRAYETLRTSAQGKLAYGAPEGIHEDLNASLAQAASLDLGKYRQAMLDAGISHQFADSQVAVLKARQEHLKAQGYTPAATLGDALSAKASELGVPAAAAPNPFALPDHAALTHPKFKEAVAKNYTMVKAALANGTHTPEQIQTLIDNTAPDDTPYASWAGVRVGSQLALHEHLTGDHANVASHLAAIAATDYTAAAPASRAPAGPAGPVAVTPHVASQTTWVAAHMLKPGDVARGFIPSTGPQAGKWASTKSKWQSAGRWKVTAVTDATKPGDSYKSVRLHLSEVDAADHETGQHTVVTKQAHSHAYRLKYKGANETAYSNYTPGKNHAIAADAPWPEWSGVGQAPAATVAASTSGGYQKKLTSVMAKNLKAGDQILHEGKVHTVAAAWAGGEMETNLATIGHTSHDYVSPTKKFQKLTPAHPLFNANPAPAPAAAAPVAHVAAAAPTVAPSVSTAIPTVSVSEALTPTVSGKFYQPGTLHKAEYTGAFEMAHKIDGAAISSDTIAEANKVYKGAPVGSPEEAQLKGILDGLKQANADWEKAHEAEAQVKKDQEFVTQIGKTYEGKVSLHVDPAKAEAVPSQIPHGTKPAHATQDSTAAYDLAIAQGYDQAVAAYKQGATPEAIWGARQDALTKAAAMGSPTDPVAIMNQAHLAGLAQGAGKAAVDVKAGQTSTFPNASSKSVIQHFKPQPASGYSSHSGYSQSQSDTQLSFSPQVVGAIQKWKGEYVYNSPGEVVKGLKAISKGQPTESSKAKAFAAAFVEHAEPSKQSFQRKISTGQGSASWAQGFLSEGNTVDIPLTSWSTDPNAWSNPARDMWLHAPAGTITMDMGKVGGLSHEAETVTGGRWRVVKVEKPSGTISGSNPIHVYLEQIKPWAPPGSVPKAAYNVGGKTMTEAELQEWLSTLTDSYGAKKAENA